MDTYTWVAIAAGAVLLLLLLTALVRRRRRHRNGTGATDAVGGADPIDTPLLPLDARERNELHRRWAAIQAEFVDDPQVAVGRANALLRTVLDRRGVPADRLEERAAAAAFVRPELAGQYRLAHRVYVEVEAERAGPTTEHDLRRAFLVYRELVLAFVDRPDDPPDLFDDGNRLTVTVGEPVG